MGYTMDVIKSFKHKGLRQFFDSGTLKGILPSHAKKLTLILDLLSAARTVQDVDFPGANLHPLKGRLKGFWAVSVSGNWRLIFQFEKGDASEVDYIDYH